MTQPGEPSEDSEPRRSSAPTRAARHRDASTKGRTLLVTVVVVVIVVLLAAAAIWVVPGSGSRFRPEPGPGAFRGLGTWVDIFEADVWANPEDAVARMDEVGVRTLYLQSSNYTRASTPIVFPESTGRLLDAAHARGIRVVAWYLPGFDDVKRDLDLSMAAIAFESENGERFDAFGMDIESVEVRDPAERTAALLRLSRLLRVEVGADYPLGAITPNPVRVATDTPYWPAFPYAELARIYDAFVPMIYFGAVAEGRQHAFEYTREGIRIIRAEANDPGVPIHAIGGLGEALTPAEVRGFLKASHRGHAIGASIYNYSTTSDTDWIELADAPHPDLTPAS